MDFTPCTARTPREKNAAVRAASSEFVLFCGENSLRAGAQQVLAAAVAAAPKTVAAFELRRFPCEHPKYYNPATCEPVWVCGDSVLVRRSAFLAVGGFDETIFQDLADVDLSWRLRAMGYGLLYVPEAGIDCTASDARRTPQTPEAEQLALAELVTGNFLLRQRFGTQTDLVNWERLVEEMAGNISTTPAMARCFVQRWRAVRRQKNAARGFYARTVQNSGFEPVFKGFDSAFLRAGASYQTVLPKKTPEFTLVMRAYKRPAHLARTLDSLRRQTYRRFCIIVVEDGKTPVCEAVCKAAAAAHMPVQYHAMRAEAGRCETGNEGVRLAKTEYVCFLDDDDYFFAEHLETMAVAIEQNPSCKLFFAGSLEAACEAGETLRVRRFWNNCTPALTLTDFFKGNPASIQAVVFHASLFSQCGGLDPALDALEDWDLWLRFALKTPFVYVNKTTSLYRVPADEKEYAARAAHFVQYRAALQTRLEAYCAKAGLVPLQTGDNIKATEQTKQSEQAEQTVHRAEGRLHETRAGKEHRRETQEAQTTIASAQPAGSAPAAQSPSLAPLRAVAQAVSTARGWRCAALLRALTCGKCPTWFGPQAIDLALADEQALNRFVFAARTSAFWQLLARGR